MGRGVLLADAAKEKRSLAGAVCLSKYGEREERKLEKKNFSLQGNGIFD